MATALAPRKAPRQARSRKTRDAILVAAGGILAREGLRGLTTNHVARAAGISIGSLYQYYPNKQAIIGALLTESRAAVLAGMEAAAEAAARDGFSGWDGIRALLVFATTAWLAWGASLALIGLFGGRSTPPRPALDGGIAPLRIVMREPMRLPAVSLGS